MNTSTLCVGADVHLKEITLRAVDKLTGDEVIAPFNVANNLPGAQSCPGLEIAIPQPLPIVKFLSSTGVLDKSVFPGIIFTNITTAHPKATKRKSTC
jgi:hypothetical protein